MSELKLIVRTHDQTRKAEIDVDTANRAADVIQGAVENWKLSEQTPYKLVNTRTGRELAAQDQLTADLVSPGDVLEVQPVLVAGA